MATKVDGSPAGDVMLRRILWERAKGELTSLTYTFIGHSEQRQNITTAINDFKTKMEMFLDDQNLLY